jgi:hypothetical protein
MGKPTRLLASFLRLSSEAVPPASSMFSKRMNAVWHLRPVEPAPRVWLAGAGIKGGIVHGGTDDIGRSITHDKVDVHDLHATILHLMGIDHTRLTYRHAGRDFRLTDVHGRLIQAILM